MKAECSECGKRASEDAIESTYCGSLCQDCLYQHCKECDVCRPDFFPNLVDQEDTEGDTEEDAGEDY